MIQNFQEQNFKGKSNTHKSVQRTIFFPGFSFYGKKSTTITFSYRFLENGKLQLKIQDKIYIDNLKKNVIFKQISKAASVGRYCLGQ